MTPWKAPWSLGEQKGLISWGKDILPLLNRTRGFSRSIFKRKGANVHGGKTIVKKVEEYIPKKRPPLKGDPRFRGIPCLARNTSKGLQRVHIRGEALSKIF